MENKLVLDKISSDISHSAVGRKFNANESITSIKQDVFTCNAVKIRSCTYRLMGMLDQQLIGT